MSKRGADKYLTDRNWEDEQEGEEVTTIIDCQLISTFEISGNNFTKIVSQRNLAKSLNSVGKTLV